MCQKRCGRTHLCQADTPASCVGWLLQVKQKRQGCAAFLVQARPSRQPSSDHRLYIQQPARLSSSVSVLPFYSQYHPGDDAHHYFSGSHCSSLSPFYLFPEPADQRTTSLAGSCTPSSTHRLSFEFQATHSRYRVAAAQDRRHGRYVMLAPVGRPPSRSQSDVG
jgi:hypothetical protein